MAAYVESNVFSPGDEIVHNGEQLAGVLIERRATRLVRNAVAIFTNAGGYQPREVRAPSGR